MAGLKPLFLRRFPKVCDLLNLVTDPKILNVLNEFIQL
ncbi:hypothetical protein GXM_07222 [Nostoc sphaeroides CCNUC1]|uniref:Uncharacterized protein n=1 Tax=Nostoc sphaeroides CCNUC1 TaxID=2653204 RepID=A0A5P8WAC9_9NOSO|nr:hypothetical protein GXM_07222 [Nostoc sphaeroides CCNUC1]